MNTKCYYSSDTEGKADRADRNQDGVYDPIQTEKKITLVSLFFQLSFYQSERRIVVFLYIPLNFGKIWITSPFDN